MLIWALLPLFLGKILQETTKPSVLTLLLRVCFQVVIDAKSVGDMTNGTQGQASPVQAILGFVRAGPVRPRET